MEEEKEPQAVATVDVPKDSDVEMGGACALDGLPTLGQTLPQFPSTSQTTPVSPSPLVTPASDDWSVTAEAGSLDIDEVGVMEEVDFTCWRHQGAEESDSSDEGIGWLREEEVEEDCLVVGKAKAECYMPDSPAAAGASGFTTEPLPDPLSGEDGEWMMAVALDDDDYNVEGGAGGGEVGGASSAAECCSSPARPRRPTADPDEIVAFLEGEKRKRDGMPRTKVARKDLTLEIPPKPTTTSGRKKRFVWTGEDDDAFPPARCSSFSPAEYIRSGVFPPCIGPWIPCTKRSQRASASGSGADTPHPGLQGTGILPVLSLPRQQRESEPTPDCFHRRQQYLINQWELEQRARFQEHQQQARARYPPPSLGAASGGQGDEEKEGMEEILI